MSGRAVRHGQPSARLSVFDLCAVLVPLCALFFAVGSAQAQDISELAKELASLRGEVEVLSGELSEGKTELQDQLRTYARQKSELTLELDREQIRLQKLRLAVAQKQKEVEAQNQRFKSLLPIFQETASALRGYIENSLPFRQEERLAELKKLEDGLEGGLMPPPKALVRLWGMVEDELRMTRESGMYRQTVSLNGDEQLADVVRLGMVMMFFKNAQGEVGHAYRSGESWAYTTFKDTNEIAMVESLFDRFKKQVRVGLFELPNAIVTKEQ